MTTKDLEALDLNVLVTGVDGGESLAEMLDKRASDPEFLQYVDYVLTGTVGEYSLTKAAARGDFATPGNLNAEIKVVLGLLLDLDDDTRVQFEKVLGVALGLLDIGFDEWKANIPKEARILKFPTKQTKEA
jgi:hypothetical protein